MQMQGRENVKQSRRLKIMTSLRKMKMQGKGNWKQSRRRNIRTSFKKIQMHGRKKIGSKEEG